MANTDPAGQVLSLLEFTRSQAVRNGRHRDCRITECLMSGLGHNGAVDPSRIGNRQPAVSAQSLDQPITVFDQRWFSAGPGARDQDAPHSLTMGSGGFPRGDISILEL